MTFRSLGDRKKPLGAATMKRIEYGLRTFGDPVMVAARGNTYDAASGSGNDYWRAWPADGSPAPAQTATAQNGVALSEPFVTMLRRNGRNHSVDGPVPTFSTARHHGLTVPPGSFVMKQFGGRLRDEHAVKSIDEPAPATVGCSAPNVVIPYRKGSTPHLPDQPVSTLATKSQHGLLRTAVQVEDCHFRMFSPRESANCQRFEPDYILTGSLGAQQLGAGNAVAVNVSQWLGASTIEALS